MPSNLQERDDAWSLLARIGRFSHKRWYVVFPVFTALALASLALILNGSLKRSIAPLSLATISGSDSAANARLTNEVFRSSLEQGVFMVSAGETSDIRFDPAQPAANNAAFVESAKAALTIIATNSSPFVGQPQSAISSPIFSSFVSADHRSILALAPLYGTDQDDSPQSLGSIGLPKIQAAVEQAERATGLEIVFVSPSLLTSALADAAVSSAKTGLAIAGFPIFAIGLVAVGSVAAALVLFVVPGLSAPLLSLLLGVGALTVVGQVLELNLFGLLALAIIVFALGSDYTIHVYYRYRQEIAAGHNAGDAIDTAMRTAGRTTSTSAAVAAVATLPLLMLPSNVFHSFAWATIVVLCILALVATMYVPAVIGMCPNSLMRLKLPWNKPERDPIHMRVSRIVNWTIGHPRAALIGAASVFALLLIPVFSVRAITGSMSLLPKHAQTVRSVEEIQSQFVAGVPGATSLIVQGNKSVLTDLDTYKRASKLQTLIADDTDTWFVAGPVQLVDLVRNQLPDGLTPELFERAGELLTDLSSRDFADLVTSLKDQTSETAARSATAGAASATGEDDKIRLALDAVKVAIAGVPGVASAAQAVVRGNYVTIQAIPRPAPESRAAQAWLNRLRGYASQVYGPQSDHFVNAGRVTTGGLIAESLDVQKAIGARLGWTIAASALILFCLLVASLRLPIAALIVVACELLIVGAAVGIMVVIFQWGWGLFNRNHVGFLEAEVLVVMIPTLLALSTSFMLLLLLPLRHNRALRGVFVHAETLRLTMSSLRGGLAGSGLLLVLFFLASLSKVVLLAQIGVGLTAIVLLDIVLIRALVLPALLGLLGRRIWWPFRIPLQPEPSNVPEVGSRQDLDITQPFDDQLDDPLSLELAEPAELADTKDRQTSKEL